MELGFLTGLGLSSSAGLNAYIPLLVLALADRFSDDITLGSPYDALSSTPGIVVILLLLTIETVVDKIPGADHVNDLVQTLVRPAAGALLMMAATTDAIDLNPGLALILGLVSAGTIHAGKAVSRPAITASTGGLGNPVVSVLEDVIAITTSVIALLIPVLVVVLLVLFGVVLFWVYRRIRRFRLRGLGPRSSSPTLRQ